MRIVNGVRALFRGNRADGELDAELRAFLETAVEQKMRAGLNREVATRAARIELGSMEAVKDRVRDVGWESGIESGWRDLRHTVRSLRRTPGFTAAVIVTVSLGVGAATSVFSVISAVLLRPLPYHNPDRLIVLWQEYTSRNWGIVPVSHPNFAALARQARTLDGLAFSVTTAAWIALCRSRVHKAVTLAGSLNA